MSHQPQSPSSPRSSSPRSSSPRSNERAGAGAVDAVLWHGEHAAGPVRLPPAEAERFVEEFNQTYAPLGWKMGEVCDIGCSPSPRDGRALRPGEGP